jgi:hypothetical protein
VLCEGERLFAVFRARPGSSPVCIVVAHINALVVACQSPLDGRMPGTETIDKSYRPAETDVAENSPVVETVRDCTIALDGVFTANNYATALADGVKSVQ